MIAIIGGFAGGLGLFFMGLNLLTQHLKALANRRVRQSAAKWTSSRWSGCLWGVVAGAVTQTMPALTFVTIGMLRSGILTPRRAFPILVGGNIGAVMLLLLVSFDIKLVVLYALGASQLITLVASEGRSSEVKLQAFSAVLFAMGMMVLGFVLIKESAAPLANHVWVQEFVALAARSLVLCLLTGTLLCLVVQSSVIVMVTGIGLAITGVLGTEQVFMLHVGSCLGSSLSLYLLSAQLKGGARQTSMYQVLHNCVLAAIFLPLIMIETYAGVPLMKAALFTLGLPVGQSLALYCIFANIVTGVFQLTVLRRAAVLTRRWWPPTETELLSQPHFIHDRTLEDAEAALRMADLEQRRLLEILSRCLDQVRQGARLGALRDSAKDVLTRIEEFLQELAYRYPNQEIDNQVSVLTRQRLLWTLDERILKLCELLYATPRHAHLDQWRTGIIEGVDAVLMVFTDMLITDDESFFRIGEQLTEGREEMMCKMRHAYLEAGSSLSDDERTNILQVTSSVEHVFSLLAELVREYQKSKKSTANARLNGAARQSAGRRTGLPAAGGVARMASVETKSAERPEDGTGTSTTGDTILLVGTGPDTTRLFSQAAGPEDRDA